MTILPARFLRLIAVLLGICAYAPSAHAADCTILNGSGTNLIDFGTIAAGKPGATDAQGTLSFLCTLTGLQLTLNYSASISTGVSGSYATRKMQHLSGSQISYNLYRDANRTQIFGNGSAGTSTVGGSCIAACPLLIPVFGRISSNPAGPPGAYSDTVTVTIEFN